MLYILQSANDEVERFIGVQLDPSEKLVFKKFASYLYKNRIIPTDDISVMMVMATRYLINDWQKAAEFYAKKNAQTAEISRPQPPMDYLSRGVSELDRLNEELDDY